MIAFPNAKINFGLNIISKRPDGYHNINSIFVPIDWKDILEIVPSDKYQISTTGLVISGNKESNLCNKAYEILKADFDIPPVHIHLHKVIPMGAGLGGGSADGAFALKLLNELFCLALTSTQLQSYAVQLGADCPFFIENKAQYVTGIGEKFEDVEVDFSDYHLAVVYPGIHVNTKDAFSGIVAKNPDTALKSVDMNKVDTWQNVVVNDFESTVFKHHPKIQAIKEQLIANGAIYASMTGTGSSVYGIFPKNSLPLQLNSIFPTSHIWTDWNKSSMIIY